MARTLAVLRQALANIALPADAQIRLFATGETAATELGRQYQRAHATADVSRAEWLPAKTRQVLDELDCLFLEVNPLMYAGDPVDCWSDRFVRDSDFWSQLRDLARQALDLLDDESCT